MRFLLIEKFDNEQIDRYGFKKVSYWMCTRNISFFFSAGKTYAQLDYKHNYLVLIDNQSQMNSPPRELKKYFFKIK